MCYFAPLLMFESSTESFEGAKVIVEKKHQFYWDADFHEISKRARESAA